MTAVASGTDGRHQRGERARTAVAGALLQLLEEGELRPPTARIAERAGVSVRLVFHHFQDTEALFEAAARLQLERILPTLTPVPLELPFPARLRRFVQGRAALLERLTPVRRAALLAEPFSATVAERLAQVRGLKRQEAAAVFGPELSALPRAVRVQAERALGAVTSFATWEALRAHQGLSVGDASAALRHLVVALLASPSRRGRT
jgi:TetR/AcrR family transcriptional regulator, regulator of autoinduction and epiphytic fitness